MRASSLMRDTKMLSTMLYMDWASMEIMMGTVMDSTSWDTGMTPSLFSVSIGGFSFFRATKNARNEPGSSTPRTFHAKLPADISKFTFPPHCISRTGICQRKNHRLTVLEKAVPF